MSPWPWTFHAELYGLANVIIDDQGRVVAHDILPADGPTMAAAPALLHFARELAARHDRVGERARALLALAEEMA